MSVDRAGLARALRCALGCPRDELPYFLEPVLLLGRRRRGGRRGRFRGHGGTGPRLRYSKGGCVTSTDVHSGGMCCEVLLFLLQSEAVQTPSVNTDIIQIEGGTLTAYQSCCPRAPCYRGFATPNSSSGNQRSATAAAKPSRGSSCPRTTPGSAHGSGAPHRS